MCQFELRFNNITILKKNHVSSLQKHGIRSYFPRGEAVRLSGSMCNAMLTGSDSVGRSPIDVIGRAGGLIICWQVQHIYTVPLHKGRLVFSKKKRTTRAYINVSLVLASTIRGQIEASISLIAVVVHTK
jgi:hypothetical protein